MEKTRNEDRRPCEACWGQGHVERQHYSPAGIELMLALCKACEGSGWGPRGPSERN